MWLTCVNAAARWEVTNLREVAMANLGKAGLAARLAAARRHAEQSWLQPASEELCRRDAHLSNDEISILEPKDLGYISSIRESALKSMVTSGDKMTQRRYYIDTAMVQTPLPT
jgi:hypothetical protein